MRDQFGLAASPTTEPQERVGATGRDVFPSEEMLEILGEFQGGGVASLGALLQALEADQFEIAGETGSESTGRFWVALEDLDEGFHHRFGPYGRAAGEQLIVDSHQAIDVGGGGETPPCSRSLVRETM